MNRLIINTRHAGTVELILANEQLIDDRSVTMPLADVLWIAYPDDGLSQALSYWLAMAQGCRLIRSYEFQLRVPVLKKANNV